MQQELRLKIRRAALAAGVDPRSVERRLAGRPVRGFAGERAAAVIRALRLPLPPISQP